VTQYGSVSAASSAATSTTDKDGYVDAAKLLNRLAHVATDHYKTPKLSSEPSHYSDPAVLSHGNE
jgi:hypothetical protein